MSYRQVITMVGTGVANIIIPTGQKYVSILNNTDNTIHLYDDIRTQGDANIRDALVICAPYTAITVPLITKSTNFTAIYITGGGVGTKAAQLLFDTENPNINTQLGSPGTNQNVNISTDSIGLVAAIAALGTKLDALITAQAATNTKLDTANTKLQAIYDKP